MVGLFCFRDTNTAFNGKEESIMKTFIKYAAVAVAGYLVGFYEMKYKVVNAMVQGFIKKEEEDSKNKEEES